MKLAPTILTKIYESDDDNSVAAIHEDGSVIGEDGTLIEHTILMKHEDYPDDEVLVDVEGGKWVPYGTVSQLTRERNDANQACAEMRAELEAKIAELQRAFRDTFTTLAFNMPSKAEFNGWYDRNVAVMDGVIAAKRRALR